MASKKNRDTQETIVAQSKKTTKKRPARKAAGKKKTSRKTAKKRAGKKTARNKARRPSAQAIGAEIDKQIEQLAKELAEIREMTEKEFARQRRNIDKHIETMKKDQDSIKARLGEFIDEHNSLKEISAGVATTAVEIEERIRKLATKLLPVDEKK